MDRLRPLIDEQKRLLGIFLSGVLGGRAGQGAQRDLAVSAAGDLADFATDLDLLSLDVGLGDAGASATATLKLARTASAMGRLATAHADRSGPAPAAFWQLPDDADFAVFQRGTDEAEVGRGRDLVLKAVGAALGDEGVKDADRKGVLDALAKVASTAPMAYASGLDAVAVRKALADKAVGGRVDSPDRADGRIAAAEAMLGWRVLEVDETAAKAAGALKELAAAWARPGISAAYRAKTKDVPPPVFRAAPVPKGAGLAAGAVHYVLELHPFAGMPTTDAAPRSKADDKQKPKKAAGPAKPLAVHFVVVPDGSRTWIAVAGDEALAVAKLTAVAHGDGKLSAHPELAGLKAGPVGAGGFFTLRGLAELATLSAALSGGSMGGTIEGLEEAMQMPGQGMVPTPFSLTAQAGGPPATTQATLLIPRGAIGDIFTALLRHGAF
jgi:hypothetical protein